jgi:hypothetical protein
MQMMKRENQGRMAKVSINLDEEAIESRVDSGLGGAGAAGQLIRRAKSNIDKISTVQALEAVEFGRSSEVNQGRVVDVSR